VEALFGTAIPKFNESSAEKFAKIVENQAFRPFVKKIVLDGENGSTDEETMGYDRDGRIDTPWSRAMRKISQFSSIKDVEFWFDEDC
jgi:hypothetical protein